ncbi:MAG: hypothetical protein ACI92C_001229 [Neolewinella sp.]|jgi:hypothetical protein
MNEKSNKLISLLVSLGRPQRRGCRKLIQSVYFSGNEDLLAFFDEITRRLDKGKSLDKRQVWASIFSPSKPFNDVRFRKFTSDLFKQIQEFLTQEMLLEEPELKNYLYLSALEKQSPDKLIKGVERNWEEIAGQEGSYEHSAYLYRHLLEERKYSLLNYEHRPYERANVEAISNNLDVYYIVMKLRHAANIHSRIQTDQSAYDLQLIPDIVHFLDTNGTYLDHPVVAIHYYMYKMLTESENHDAYYHYKDIIIRDTDSMVGDQAYEFFQPALNYCRRRINESNRDFLAEYLEIYRYALEHNLVYDDGKLDPLQFRNTILIALRHGDYTWAEHYIENYQDRLPEKQRSNAVNYNSATLYFYQENYDKALNFLRDVEYENTTYNLNSKTMLLAIYYETGADTALDSLFDSVTAYLNRHKEIPDINQRAYRNLVTFTRRLTRMLPGDKKALEQLKTDLAEKKYVASRPWLEEKIDAF